jgi:hypothetical protein
LARRGCCSADAPLNGWLLDQAKATLLRMSDPGGGVGDED